MPDDLRVLFIGESPPTGGTFFYDANSILYVATREAFLAGVPALRKRANFLDAFRLLGCYLEDLSVQPIDKLPKAARQRARREAVPALARRLRGVSPRVVVVAVKGIRPQVSTALDLADLAAVPCESLPFPGQWHRDEFVTSLTELVRQWRRRRLLRPGVWCGCPLR